MRPLPAHRIGAAHGLLRALEQRGRLRPDEFVTDFAEPALFAPDTEADPGRTRQYLSLLRATGLVHEDRGVVELTDLGRRYARAGDPSDLFGVSAGQAEWLRRALRERHLTDSVWQGAAIALSLYGTLGAAEQVSLADAGRCVAHLGRVGWDNDNTFRLQGTRFTRLLQDMELLDGERRLTPLGRQLLDELRLPQHVAMVRLAEQLHPAGAAGVAAAAEAERALAEHPEPPPAPPAPSPPPEPPAAAPPSATAGEPVRPPAAVPAPARRPPGAPVAPASALAEPFLDTDAVRRSAEERGLRLDAGVYAAAVAALAAGRHLVLTGGPGHGKTTLARVLADAAQVQGHSTATRFVAAGAGLSVRDLLGRRGPQGAEPGVVAVAVADDAWVILDELDRVRLDRLLGRLSPLLGGEPLGLPAGHLQPSPQWRVIATMGELAGIAATSGALRRRFAFVEVPSPPADDFRALVDGWAGGDPVAAAVGRRLLALGGHVDLGPAVVRDAVRYVRHRRAMAPADELSLGREALAALVLPQLEGLEKDLVDRAVAAVGLGPAASADGT